MEHVYDNYLQLMNSLDLKELDLFVGNIISVHGITYLSKTNELTHSLVIINTVNLWLEFVIKYNSKTST